MNIKKSLSTLIILTMLFTGCTSYQVQNKAMSLPDESTKQKTMTKVQNDINEIINKDYEYVLSNLGEPNVTSYLLNKNKLSNIDKIDDIEQLTNINLIYLKNVSEEGANSSALYLTLKDKVVKKAQIIDYSSPNMNKYLDKSKVLINCFSDGDIVKTSDLDIENLDNFIDIDSSEIGKIVGNKQPSYNAYLYDGGNKSINVYHLDNEDKLLAVFIDDNKVSEIKILDNKKEVVREIKNIMLDN